MHWLSYPETHSENTPMLGSGVTLTAHLENGPSDICAYTWVGRSKDDICERLFKEYRVLLQPGWHIHFPVGVETAQNRRVFTNEVSSKPLFGSMKPWTSTWTTASLDSRFDFQDSLFVKYTIIQGVKLTPNMSVQHNYNEWKWKLKIQIK